MPANKTERKKSPPMIFPKGIWEKTFGSVINISGGPEAGSIWKAKNGRNDRKACQKRRTGIENGGHT